MDHFKEKLTNDDLVIDEKTREKIRTELSSLSFEDIQKLKEKIGSKMYDEAVFGVKKKMKSFKRANKNRPREMSSKIRVPVLKNQIPSIKKPEPRDPRFDPLCGEFVKKKFKKNFEFVNEIKKNERKQLKQELENTTDPERKLVIKTLIQRLDNQIREQEREDKEEQQRQENNKEIVEKLRKGEKPVFKRKSEKKIEDLVGKYEELKRSNKLQKHIEKKTKKLVSKERRQNKLRDE